MPADLASVRSLLWHEKLLRFLRTAHPYWNRSGGSDHLWPFTHDEGACYAPQALRQATLLVHWGRTHRRPNGSSEYHLWRVRPWGQRMYGWERCYDPCKDLVTSPHLAPPRPTSPNLARPRTTSRDLARPRAISPTLVRSHRPRSAQVLPP